MAIFTNTNKNTSTILNYAKNAVASFSNVLKRIKAYLLSEDSTHLLLEDGGSILIDRGIEYDNLIKN